MNINEVISKYLYECAKPENKGGYLPDIETVFNVKYDYTGEQSIFDRAEKIILENGLLDKEEAGWGANQLTYQIIEEGGYVQWLANRKAREAMSIKAEESRNRQTIADERRKKETHIMNWISILISLISLFISIIALCK